jgi:hypothetical protein
MKKTLLTLLVASFALPLFAQPTITSTSFDFGKTTRYFTTNDSVNPNIVPPANNVTWDYRFLTARAQDSILFSKKTNSSFASSFPLANEVIEEYTAWMASRAVERHNYKDSQVYLAYGGVFLPSSTYYYKPFQMLFKFPFVYNSAFNDSLYGIVTYDGYGSLQLPGGTFNNVYRTKTIDSISPSIMHYTYNWFNAERRLLTVNVNRNSYTTAFYSPYKSSTSISKAIIKAKPIVFPNPSQGEFTIQNAIVGAKIEIYNALGQLVLQDISLAQHHSLYLDKKGVYIVKVTTKNGIVTDRLFVN